MVVHNDYGVVRVVQDRCMRWSCEHCWLEKLGKKTEHVVIKDRVVVRLDGDPELRKRAYKAGAGYMKTFIHGVSEPFVIADPRLYPRNEVFEGDKALRQLVMLAWDPGIKMVCFNSFWQYDPEAHHTFLGKSTANLATIHKALDDAGMSDGTIGNMDIETARRVLDSFLHGIEYE